MSVISSKFSDLSKIDQRARNSAIDILTKPGTIEDAIFQHSVLCQTFLPYRNPGKDERIWQHKQGKVSLAMQASEAINPQTGEFEFIMGRLTIRTLKHAKK